MQPFILVLHLRWSLKRPTWTCTTQYRRDNYVSVIRLKTVQFTETLQTIYIARN